MVGILWDVNWNGAHPRCLKVLSYAWDILSLEFVLSSGGKVSNVWSLICSTIYLGYVLRHDYDDRKAYELQSREVEMIYILSVLGGC